MSKKAIVLLSGGLDSCTCLSWALSRGYICHALSFDYGQLNVEELERAEAIAKHSNVPRTVVKIDFSYLKTPVLTKEIEVPLAASAEEVLTTSTFSAFTLPGRNLHFMAHAMSLAVQLDFSCIVTGSNSDDGAFSDCSKAFIAAVAQVSRYAIDTGPLEILSPLIELKKTQILQMALELKAPIDLTLSCYRPKDHKACGVCHACLIRSDAFQKIGQKDHS